MKNVLILGANGFIGRGLVERLAEYNVTAYDHRLPEDKGVRNNVIWVKGDYFKDDFLEITKGKDVIYHLISTTLPSGDTSELPSEIERNVIPTLRLLEAMVRNGVKKIIFASSAGTVYGSTNHVNSIDTLFNPECSYGVQKAVQETYIKFYAKKYGFNHIIARISNPYGAGQDPKRKQGVIPIFVRNLYQDKPIDVFGDGEGLRDYIYIDDALDALVKMCTYEGKKNVFHVALGMSFSVNYVVHLIETVNGKKFCKINHLPERGFDVRYNILDSFETKKELEWQPKYDLVSGIERISAEIRKETFND